MGFTEFYENTPGGENNGGNNENNATEGAKTASTPAPAAEKGSTENNNVPVPDDEEKEIFTKTGVALGALVAAVAVAAPRGVTKAADKLAPSIKPGGITDRITRGAISKRNIETAVNSSEGTFDFLSKFKTSDFDISKDRTNIQDVANKRKQLLEGVLQILKDEQTRIGGLSTDPDLDSRIGKLTDTAGNLDINKLKYSKLDSNRFFIELYELLEPSSTIKNFRIRNITQSLPFLNRFKSALLNKVNKHGENSRKQKFGDLAIAKSHFSPDFATFERQFSNEIKLASIGTGLTEVQIQDGLKQIYTRLSSYDVIPRHLHNYLLGELFVEGRTLNGINNSTGNRINYVDFSSVNPDDFKIYSDDNNVFDGKFKGNLETKIRAHLSNPSLDAAELNRVKGILDTNAGLFNNGIASSLKNDVNARISGLPPTPPAGAGTPPAPGAGTPPPAPASGPRDVLGIRLKNDVDVFLDEPSEKKIRGDILDDIDTYFKKNRMIKGTYTYNVNNIKTFVEAGDEEGLKRLLTMNGASNPFEGKTPPIQWYEDFIKLEKGRGERLLKLINLSLPKTTEIKMSDLIKNHNRVISNSKDIRTMIDSLDPAERGGLSVNGALRMLRKMF